MGAGGLGIGAIIVIFAISYFTGISPQVLMSGAEMVGVGTQNQAPTQSAPVDPNDPTRSLSRPGRRRDGGSVGGGAAGADRRPIPARDAGHL